MFAYLFNLYYKFYDLFINFTTLINNKESIMTSDGFCYRYNLFKNLYPKSSTYTCDLKN